MLFWYILKRVLIFIPTLFAISIVVFLLNLYAPGDPVEQILSPGGQQNNPIDESAYLDVRRRLRLDLPVFYFSWTSQAYPDTLHRISRKEEQAMLNRMVNQYGNWSEIQSYYSSLKGLGKAVSAFSGDSASRNDATEVQILLRSLYSTYAAPKIQKDLAELGTIIRPNQPLARLLPDLKAVQRAYQGVIERPTHWKKYVPKIAWYGTNNQYHIWIFGNKTWFPKEKIFFQQPAQRLSTAEMFTTQTVLEQGKHYEIRPNIRLIANGSSKTKSEINQLTLFRINLNGIERLYSLKMMEEEPFLRYGTKNDAISVGIQLLPAATTNNLTFEYAIEFVHLVNYDPYRTYGGFLRLDFGRSYQDQRPVRQKISEAIYWTILISTISIVFTYLISIPLGVFSARHQGSTVDNLLTTALFMLYSLPNFWVATLLIIFLCQPAYLDLFPSFGLGDVPPDASWWETLQKRAYHLILPLFCWTYPSLAFLSRQMRGAMVGTLRQDFIRTAYAKGLPEGKVIWKHAFRNSLLPIITLFANVFPRMVAGSIVIEVIFSLPGMGKILLDAIFLKDFPMVFAIVLIAAVLTMVGYLIADILYALADPRIKY